jgi:hypothetical protein
MPELLEQRIFPDGASAEATRLMLESMVRVIASGK